MQNRQRRALPQLPGHAALSYLLLVEAGERFHYINKLLGLARAEGVDEDLIIKAKHKAHKIYSKSIASSFYPFVAFNPSNKNDNERRQQEPPSPPLVIAALVEDEGMGITQFYKKIEEKLKEAVAQRPMQRVPIDPLVVTQWYLLRSSEFSPLSPPSSTRPQAHRPARPMETLSHVDIGSSAYRAKRVKSRRARRVDAPPDAPPDALAQATPPPEEGKVENGEVLTVPSPRLDETFLAFIEQQQRQFMEQFWDKVWGEGNAEADAPKDDTAQAVIPDPSQIGLAYDELLNMLFGEGRDEPSDRQ